MSGAKLARFLLRHFDDEDNDENETATIDGGEQILVILNDVASQKIGISLRGMVR